MNLNQEKQNRALFLLAGAIQGVARSNGTHIGDIAAQIYEILNPPLGSAGVITIKASADSQIPEGAELTDVAGLHYRVTAAGTYTVEKPVPVSSVDVGAGTYLKNGAVLTWVLAPPFCEPTATVGTIGGTDGLDPVPGVPDPEHPVPVPASFADKEAYVKAGYKAEDYAEFKKNEAKAAKSVPPPPKATHERS